MSISKKFVAIIFLILLVFISVNIYFLQFFTSRYFIDYLETIQKEIEAVYQQQDQQETEKDITASIQLEENSILDEIFSNPEITPEILSEIEETYKDLEGLSNSLDKYIDSSPRLNEAGIAEYFLTQGVDESNIENVINLNSLRVFLQNTPFLIQTSEENSAERKFVSDVLSAMLGINLILMIILLSIVYIFTNYTFRTINNISKNIDKTIDTGSYDRIEYQSKDEFGALVGSINKLNEKLALQEAIRSQFLTDMSHELKTPMAAIRVYLEGIQEGVIKLNKDNTQSLIDEIKRLTRIVESMMYFQRFEENKIDANVQNILLAHTFDWIKEYYKADMKRNDQSLSYDGRNNDNILFDKDSFTQIIHNLMSNFIKYAGKGSHMRIKLIEESSSNILIFRDNGRGVSQDTLPFLKEKFYQVDQAKTGDIEKRGIGVGLSIVEKIIKEFGGFMDIISDT